MDTRFLIRLLLGVVASATTAFALGQIATRTGDPAFVLSLLGSAVVLLAAFRLSIDASSRYSTGATWNMYAAALMALMLSLGPLAACGGAVVAFAIRGVTQRAPLARTFENAGSIILGLGAAGWVFNALGGRVGQLDLPGDYVPIVASAICLAVVIEVAFVLWAVSDSTESVPLRVALRDELESLRGYLVPTTIESFVGAAVGLVLLVEPLAAPAIVPLAASLYLAVKRQADVQAVTERALESFASIVDERDSYTFEHSTRVCEYSMRIGEALHYSERQLKSLYWTSRLHDLGKVAVDNAILNKPGKLTDEEFEIMKSHPVVSARLLSSFSFGALETDVVLCHHERYDGRGYLRREREAVPFDAFIIAVADSFDAMTSDRPYRKALPVSVALAEIHRNLGTQFHPVAGQAFLDAMGFDEACAEQTSSELGSAGVDRAVPGGPARDATDQADRKAA